MSVPTDAVSELVFAGAGSTAPLGITFKFIDPADLVVTRIVGGEENPAPLVRGVHFTVTGGNGSTGSVIPAVAIPVGTSWRVRRETPAGQPSVLPSGKYQPEQIERAIDRQAMGVQELRRESTRSLKAPRGETMANLPAASKRKGNLLAFDGDGQVALVPLTQGLKNLGVLFFDDGAWGGASITSDDGPFSGTLITSDDRNWGI